MTCRMCWGSHACDREADHDGIHQCFEDKEMCSEFKVVSRVGTHHFGEVRYSFDGKEDWSKWLETTGFET